MYDSLECQNNVQSGVRVPPTEVSGCLPLACHGDPDDPAVVAAEEVEFRCSWSDRQRRETPPDRWKDLTMLSPTQIHLPMTEIFPPFSLDYILWSASDLFPVLFCPDPGLSPLTWAACLANQICPLTRQATDISEENLLSVDVLAGPWLSPVANKGRQWAKDHRTRAEIIAAQCLVFCLCVPSCVCVFVCAFLCVCVFHMCMSVCLWMCVHVFLYVSVCICVCTGLFCLLLYSFFNFS